MDHGSAGDPGARVPRLVEEEFNPEPDLVTTPLHNMVALTVPECPQALKLVTHITVPVSL